MPKVAQIIGGAGTGKTTHLLSLMEWWLRDGKLSPEEIGFTSFTRAARREASDRAASKFNLNPAQLESDGWFKTVHACCFSAIRAKSSNLLSDSKADRKWVSDAVGQEVQGVTDAAESLSEALAGKSDADRALALWDTARNRLVSIEEVWIVATACDEKTPSLKTVQALIEKYEQRKRLDDRYDFTDILARYAGYRFNVKGLPTDWTPEGYIPPVKVWFLDEQQDNSALTDAVSRRISSEAEWAYISGDPFQSIYGFSGSNPKHFMSWPVTDGYRRVLPQSFRCPREVHELGERILQDCSDYWDREINPASHSGEVSLEEFESPWAREVAESLDQSWLLLARTNFLTNKLIKRMDALGIPWLPAKGHGGKWAAPVRMDACKGLMSLQNGYPIQAREWIAICKQLPSKSSGSELLRRGTKTEWESYTGEPTDLNDLAHIEHWGGTESLKAIIQSGKWKQIVDGAPEFAAAWQLYGPMAVCEPKVRIGTIHAVKGMEADNVALLTTTTHQVTKATEDQSGADEERRVWYVGATRARKNLKVLREVRATNRWELPI